MTSSRSTATDSVRALRALDLAGAFPSWRLPTLAAIAGLAAWESIAVGHVETAVTLAGFLVPFFAGTSALALARLGRLDMVVGAGVTRRRLAVMAVGGALLPVGFVGGIALGLSGVPDAQRTAFAGMTLFMAGVGFLGGLAAPATLVGVLWFVARGLVLMSSWGRETIHVASAAKLDPGLCSVSPGRLAVVLAGMPEVSFGVPVPGFLPALFAAVGAACLVAGIAWFERADWPGKRME